MKVVDLVLEHQKTYFMCLEEWSDEMKEAGDHKAVWYEKMKDRGLRVKLAESDSGQIAGMIQYVPIGLSLAEGEGLYFVNCIWVHGYREGVGNYQRQGMGKALLHAAEEDARTLGAKGISAWGIAVPAFMRASWFKKQGYRVADRQGISILLWKPFSEYAAPPRWIRRKKKPEGVPGKVTVTSFINGWCPAQSIVYERAKRAAAELGDRVVFQEYDTSERSVFLEWGIADALFVDGKEVRTGPPPSYEKIKRLIEKRAKKFQ